MMNRKIKSTTLSMNFLKSLQDIAYDSLVSCNLSFHHTRTRDRQNGGAGCRGSGTALVGMIAYIIAFVALGYTSRD